MRILLLLTPLAAAALARADAVTLRGGAEVRGTVVSGVADGSVRVRTLSGLSVTLDAEEVVSVVKRTPRKEEYVTRSREVADTVAAREALVEWCVRNRHAAGRVEQYAAILKLDPRHEAANKAVGNVERDGVWMTKAEAARAEGLVPFGDRWVTPAEAELLAEQEELDEARLAWFPKVAAIRRRLDEVGEPALADVRAITDKDAAEALVNKLGDDPRVPVRLEVVDALRRFGHFRVVRKLVRFALYDADATVRQRAVEAIPVEFALTAADQFVRKLGDLDNAIVCRAGAALQTVGTREAVPRLITALKTTHSRTVRVLDTSPRYSRTADGRVVMTNGPTTRLPPEVLRGLRSGAYPFGVNVLPSEADYVTKTVKVSVPNEPVLAALVTITQQNFGYDEAAWNRWWRREGKWSEG